MVEKYQLSNGLPVICEHLGHVHSVAFGIWIKAGSQDEQRKNNGMAHMMEHMIFKGTSSRNAKQIADEIAEIGGNLDAYTSKEWTSFYGWVLPKNLKKAMELLGDMILYSNFEEEELSKEKGIVMEEIDMYKDSPEDVVHEMLEQQVWKGHPLGYLISGEREIVEKFQTEDLKTFHRSFYTADNMILSVAGAIQIKDVLSIAEHIFGSIPKSGKKRKNTVPIFMPCVYQEEKDIEQIHINLVFDSITSVSEDRYPFSVLNAVLGGGVNSRLFMKVREEMGIAYSIYSYGSSFEKAGLFHLYAAVNPSQAEAVLEAIGEEIKQFLKNGVTKEELIRAREQIKTDLIIQGESTKGHMSSNAKEMLQFGHVILLEETLRRIDKVNCEEIMRCIRTYFSVEKIGAAFVGNFKEIPKSLMTLERIREIFTF